MSEEYFLDNLNSSIPLLKTIGCAGFHPATKAEIYFYKKIKSLEQENKLLKSREAELFRVIKNGENNYENFDHTNGKRLLNLLEALLEYYKLSEKHKPFCYQDMADCINGVCYCGGDKLINKVEEARKEAGF